MPKVVDLTERRIELAAAAARVIARSGLGGATMREVSAEAGWTTGALTHYFADKRELLRFTLEESLDLRRARHEERGAMTPDDALRDTLVCALPIDDSSRLHWIVTVAFCAQAAGDTDLASIQRDAYRRFLGAVTSLVERTGRTDEPEQLIALVDGIALQALFDPESWPPDRQLAMVDAALDGGRP
ncbi:TetR/AcrR family transcriptional regulator [soil metagenome]